VTALPTRKLEAFRYADIDALSSVWEQLAAPEFIQIAAHKIVQQIWLPSGKDIEIRRTEIVLEPGAHMSLFALNTARDYGRIELNVTLREGARFTLNAANIGAGESNLEIVTTVRHDEPSTVSRQVVRSVLGGKAVGSYLGKVAVARDAQQSDGEQSVKAMLLDRGASANCKPELEIFADDVQCVHGASVGELDAMQLFYAESRGLDPAGARALLLEGFVMGLWDEAQDSDAICEAARAALQAVTA